MLSSRSVSVVFERQGTLFGKIKLDFETLEEIR